MIAYAVIETLGDLTKALNRITFAPSCVDFEWTWEAKEVAGQDLKGWLIRTSFTRPDTDTGVVSRGFGRWEFVSQGTSESGVIKTAWLLVELIVRHELMEGFLVDGIRIFNPHHTVEQLQLPAMTHPEILQWVQRVKGVVAEVAADEDGRGPYDGLARIHEVVLGRG